MKLALILALICTFFEKTSRKKIFSPNLWIFPKYPKFDQFKPETWIETSSRQSISSEENFFVLSFSRPEIVSTYIKNFEFERNQATARRASNAIPAETLQLPEPFIEAHLLANFRLNDNEQ